MSDMKCPSCGQELKQDYYDCEMLECHNPKCKHYYDSCIGREELWQELICTRKVLDVAVDVLKTIKYRNETYNRDDSPDCIDATLALEQITTLIKGGSNE